MVEFKLTLALDEAFQANLWAPSAADLRSLVAEAIGLFEKQFPETRFKINPEWKIWQPGLANYGGDFPLSLVISLPKVKSRTQLSNFINGRLVAIGFDSEDRDFDPEHVKIGEDGSINEDAFYYLMGYLEGRLKGHLMPKLVSAFPTTGTEIVFGFSGVFPRTSFSVPYGCIGYARHAGSHAIFPLNVSEQRKELSKIILHELGHIFDADHPEDASVKSIMAAKLQEDHPAEFDPQARIKIEANIALRVKK